MTKYLSLFIMGIFMYPALTRCQTIIKTDSSSQPAKLRLDSAAFGWLNSIVYLESVYTSLDKIKVKDTLIGTALLVTDNNKFYLVTSKHILQSALFAKDQQVINDSIFVKTNYRNKNSIWIGDLSTINKSTNAYVFSTDEEDLAIISMQRKYDRNLLDGLQDQGLKPVGIEAIDTSDEHQPGEKTLSAVYSLAYSPPAGLRMKSLGMGKIKTFDRELPNFTIDVIVHQGNNGAPLISRNNNKVIGFFSYETGITSNEDILRRPYFATTSGTVVKARYIIPLLRKLQQNENNWKSQ